MASEKQEQAGHSGWCVDEHPMCYFVSSKIFSGDCVAETQRLLGCEAEALAGDSVHGEGSVAYQGCVSARDFARAFERGDAAEFGC